VQADKPVLSTVKMSHATMVQRPKPPSDSQPPGGGSLVRTHAARVHVMGTFAHHALSHLSLTRSIFPFFLTARAAAG
jgi:hypothetical protein